MVAPKKWKHHNILFLSFFPAWTRELTVKEGLAIVGYPCHSSISTTNQIVECATSRSPQNIKYEFDCPWMSIVARIG